MKYIIDANLPPKLDIWHTKKFIHVFNLNPFWKDSEIWKYAKENNLVIITKDVDFSDRIIITKPPPKVIHFQIGNMKLKELYNFLNTTWITVANMSEDYKLVKVTVDNITGIN